VLKNVQSAYSGGIEMEYPFELQFERNKSLYSLVSKNPIEPNTSEEVYFYYLSGLLRNEKRPFCENESAYLDPSVKRVVLKMQRKGLTTIPENKGR